ncbi:hypothetical protein FZEAL_10306 [Fusarium zealandicum]|uniref:Copper transport protein n=1 Tax=Fusarium zealandicum TaxID=1053134 RepID=A0A8H4U3M6_9HYPO|nr:hypothetical protein FZEAL_10306 [Fusarium zealandicum]
MSFVPRHEMPGMDTGHDTSSSDSSSSHGASSIMAMVFQTERETPLYSASWTPSSAGAYAGTCIFLAVLAIVARGLIALKAVQEARWLDREAQRRYVVVNSKIPLAEQVASSPDARRMTLSENGVEETVVVVERKRATTRPWRFSVDPVRACLDTVIVGIGYLLPCLPQPEHVHQDLTDASETLSRLVQDVEFKIDQGQVSSEEVLCRLLFRALLSATKESPKLAFSFIDGLDESDGDHSELVELVRRVNEKPNVKICTSSRPWDVLKDNYERNPMLRLEAGR